MEAGLPAARVLHDQPIEVHYVLAVGLGVPDPRVSTVQFAVLAQRPTERCNVSGMALRAAKVSSVPCQIRYYGQRRFPLYHIGHGTRAAFVWAYLGVDLGVGVGHDGDEEVEQLVEAYTASVPSIA
eukprot:1981007-Rhodomonas_salina.1